MMLGGVSRVYGYDPLGRITFVSDPGAGYPTGTSYAYDILDRVRSVHNMDSSSRSINFGAGSKVVQDERGYSTTYRYLSYGNPEEQYLVSNEAPLSATNIAINRNAENQVSSIVQGGMTRIYKYDGRGFLTYVNNPETGVTSYGRDDANNMTSKTVGSSGQTIFQYDGQNRLHVATYPNGTPAVTKTYTYTNKVQTVVSSVASRSYDYDPNDNLSDESLVIDGISFQLIYGYNGNDQLASLTYPSPSGSASRVISYSPDALGRPTQVSGFVSSVGYWPSGQISQINYRNGAISNYGQNNRLWPSYFQTTAHSTDVLNSAYSYDGLGNLRSIADNVDTQFSRSLDYDPVNRLTTASGPWGSGSINYDATGNISRQTFGAAVLNYSYGSNNLLGSVTGTRNQSFSYDAYGDVSYDGTRDFGYDGAPNLLCAACSVAGASSYYQYDGLNQRVSVLKGGVRTYEFYSFNGSLLQEFTPSFSNRLSENIYLGTRRVATVGPAPTTISLPAQSLSAVAGRAVTLNATIGGGLSPTGTVRFGDALTALGTSPVVGGKATLSTTFQTSGIHTLTAAYSGDGVNFGQLYECHDLRLELHNDQWGSRRHRLQGGGRQNNHSWSNHWRQFTYRDGHVL